jgi:hypothetical protein
VGDPWIRPEHIMDYLCRDFALLPEALISATRPLEVCSVRETLPDCDVCDGLARYDIWATPFQAPGLLCEACAEPFDGVELGAGSATYLLTLEEMPWQIRDICDDVTRALGRRSLWR